MLSRFAMVACRLSIFSFYIYSESWHPLWGTGIQQLLAAEKEAQQIVNAARTEKLARLKQAEEEIAEYRAQVAHEFQRKLTERRFRCERETSRLEKETDEKVHHQKTEVSNISKGVDGMLMKHLKTV